MCFDDSTINSINVLKTQINKNRQIKNTENTGNKRIQECGKKK